MEIRKREAKVFLMTKQMEDNEEDIQAAKENNSNANVAQLKEEMNQLNKSI